MSFKVKIFITIILGAFFIQQSVRAQTDFTNDQELPAVKVAMSEDQSIIIERILYEGLKRSGYQMIAKATGMRTAVADVNYGDAVILPLQTDGWDKLYPNLIKVPVAIEDVEFTAYSQSGSSHQFSRWEDMTGLRMGYRWQNESVENNISRTNAGKLVTLNDINELWASLLGGEIDVVLLPRMSHYEYRFPSGIKRSGVVEKQPAYTYINNKHEHLVPLLEKAYREMFNDGTMLSLYKNQESRNDKPIILHINSYNAQNEWERSQIEAIHVNIETEITGAGFNEPEFYNFFLNSNELHNRAGINAIVSDMIRTGFIERNPEMIIASGNEALEFVLNNYYLLFPNTPVLFYGVQGLNSSALHGLEEHITGISETVSFINTVSLMLKLYPKTKRIFILNDYSLFRSLIIRNEILERIESGSPDLRSPLAGSPQMEFIFSENKPFAEILEEISSFESDTLVLIGNYFSDSKFVFYSEADVQRMTANASINPVFCLTTSFIGDGTFGGLV